MSRIDAARRLLEFYRDAVVPDGYRGASAAMVVARRWSGRLGQGDRLDPAKAFQEIILAVAALAAHEGREMVIGDVLWDDFREGTRSTEEALVSDIGDWHAETGADWPAFRTEVSRRAASLEPSSPGMR